MGDHGCEYMTGGRVIILGPCGRNFGAGMSGGIAFVYDPLSRFPRNVNRELVQLESLDDEEEVRIFSQNYAENMTDRIRQNDAGRAWEIHWVRSCDENFEWLDQKFETLCSSDAKRLQSRYRKTKSAKETVTTGRTKGTSHPLSSEISSKFRWKLVGNVEWSPKGTIKWALEWAYKRTFKWNF